LVPKKAGIPSSPHLRLSDAVLLPHLSTAALLRSAQYALSTCSARDQLNLSRKEERETHLRSLPTRREEELLSVRTLDVDDRRTTLLGRELLDAGADGAAESEGVVGGEREEGKLFGFGHSSCVESSSHVVGRRESKGESEKWERVSERDEEKERAKMR
jgi:hypothetical protein